MLLRKNSSLESIFEYTSGFYFNPSDEYADIVLQYSESVTWDITNGENVQVVDGRLVPIEPGTAVLRSQVIPLTHLEVIGGSKISWKGDGVTVDISFDLGATWRALSNDAAVPGIVSGANVSDIAVMFRETVTGHLESLDFVVYGSTTIFSADNPAASIVTGGPLKVSKHPVSLEDGFNNGLILESMYAGVRLPYQESRAYGIELWVKQISSVPGASIVDVVGATGATVNNGQAIGAFWTAAYVNGQAVSTISLTTGVWTQIALVTNTPIGSIITLNANSSYNNPGRLCIGPVLVHQQVPSAAEIKYRYDYAYNQHKVRVIGEILTVADVETRVYDLDWTIIQDTGY